MKFSFERIFIGFFIVIIAGVVALGIVNYNANKAYADSAQWVEHTDEVLKESGIVLSSLQDLGIRGYIMTGDTSLLSSFHNAEKVCMPRLMRLKELSKDNPVQQKRVDALISYAQARLDMSARYKDIFDHKKLDSAALAAFTVETKTNMAAIRRVLAEITAEEEALLKRRKETAINDRNGLNLSVSLIFVEITVLLTGTLVAIILYFRHRTRSEKELVALNNDLAKANSDLHKANAELESFSYSVSHDLRAPLRIIDGFSKILAEEYKNTIDDEGRRFIETVRSNAQRMGLLIDDLLSFSRIGRQELSVHEIDMPGVVNHVIESFRILNQNQAADIRVGNILNARCDEVLIQQVWTNLLSNALKYSKNKEHPVISITTSETESELIYSVADNGVGFNMQFSGKLFGVFQRLHKPSDYEGTGVGLALVNRIVTRHKGRVWAEAKENEGATFYFSLPKHNSAQYGVKKPGIIT